MKTSRVIENLLLTIPVFLVGLICAVVAAFELLRILWIGEDE